MDRKELIERIKNEYSTVEIYNLKKEILRHLKNEESDARKNRRSELLQIPMKELREVGYSVGAKDNSKKELVEEILDKEGL